jgi:hypothetical protein
MSKRTVGYSHNVEDGFSIGWFVKAGRLYLAASACNQLDQFSRKTARSIINDRLGKRTKLSISFPIAGKYVPEVDGKRIRDTFHAWTFVRPRESQRQLQSIWTKEIQEFLGDPPTADTIFDELKKDLRNYFKLPLSGRKALITKEAEEAAKREAASTSSEEE